MYLPLPSYFQMFLFEWVKVCATALQEWWCLRWLDIDSGPQCGIPTYPSPASYWHIVILALSIFSLIFFLNFSWFYTPAKLIFLISMSKYVLNMVDNNLNWIWLFQHFVRLSWFSVCFLNIVFWLAFISRNSYDILDWPPTCSPMPHIR